MSCSGCERELIERPNAICPNVIHWRAWSEELEKTTLGVAAHPFEVEHRCVECGEKMLPAVSLWRCAKDPNNHQMVGPEIGLEIRRKL